MLKDYLKASLSKMIWLQNEKSVAGENLRNVDSNLRHYTQKVLRVACSGTKDTRGTEGVLPRASVTQVWNEESLNRVIVSDTERTPQELVKERQRPSRWWRTCMWKYWGKQNTKVGSWFIVSEVKWSSWSRDGLTQFLLNNCLPTSCTRINWGQFKIKILGLWFRNSKSDSPECNPE